jgi:hypothetical protein
VLILRVSEAVVFRERANFGTVVADGANAHYPIPHFFKAGKNASGAVCSTRIASVICYCTVLVAALQLPTDISPTHKSQECFTENLSLSQE